MTLSTAPAISIKGIREGLLITLDEGAYDDVLYQLSVEIEQKQEFLRGSRIALAVGRRPLFRDQLAEIQALFHQFGLTLWTVLAETVDTRSAARQLNLATRLPGSHTDLDGNARAVVEKKEVAVEETAVTPNTLLLQETIRSGRSIYHEGHVVIVGDVNPGAEVVAGGNVIVWGRLRGLVHAGALGDKTAVICALHFAPTQLRIADQIAIPPDDKRHNPTPEQAAIQEGQIIVEGWR
ncbi:MAG: septum site-determining protein MinC [Ardenticatenaceae bacterium]|nr:septum site-determining protein MinC [Ardenticatenaceae bacterium]